ncbi:hypothetical protein ABPG74_010295 [Tetrahymena malaccensis]
MNSFNQSSSSNNNKENVVDGQVKPSTAPPAASSALSFRERLEQQLKKAKELQKQAQIDLEITKKDSVKKDEPAPTQISNSQNPSVLSSTTVQTSSQAPAVSMASSFSSRFSSILQRDQSKLSQLNTPSAASSTVQSSLPASTENKFSAISSRLSQLRESLNQTLSNSEIKLPSQPISSTYNRETKSEIRDLSDIKQSTNNNFLLETNKQISDSSLVSNIKANTQSVSDSTQIGSQQIKKNEDNNQDCIIVEEKSTLKPKQAEVEMCIEIEANPKDLIQQKMHNSTSKSYFSNTSIGTPKILEGSSLKIDSSIKSNTSSISKLSSSKEGNKNNSPNENINNQNIIQSAQVIQKQETKLSESQLKKSDNEIKEQTNVSNFIADLKMNSSNLQSVKSQIVQNQAIHEDLFQNKSKLASEKNNTFENKQDFNSKIQHIQTQNDILKIIDNIPSSSESDLSQINSQPNSQQIQDQLLLKQEPKAFIDILNQQPIQQEKDIKDDRNSNTQLNNNQDSLYSNNRQETLEVKSLNEEKNIPNQQNSEIRQEQILINQNITMQEQKNVIKSVEKEINSVQKSSVKSIEKVLSSGKKSTNFEFNETKLSNIVDKENYQRQNSLQNSDLSLSQNEKKHSTLKQEINQTILQSQIETNNKYQCGKDNLNEETTQTIQNMDEETNKTNQIELELNEQNNQTELKTDILQVEENNQDLQNGSIQLSQLQSNQIKSTSQSSENFQQEVQPLEIQKSEGQFSFEQNQIQNKSSQNEVNLEVESSKQSAQKLSQILDSLDRMEEEEENEQKIETENIQNQQDKLNQQENANMQMEVEQKFIDNTYQMENSVQNNTDQEVLQTEQQTNNNQTTMNLEEKNQEQIEGTQMISEICENLKQDDDIELNNLSQEKQVQSNKSSLIKDQSLRNVISQIEECEKLDKIIDEDDEQNQRQKDNLQMLVENQDQANQNEKKSSLEKLVDSNKSSLQKDKSLSSILSKIEELEKMEDEDDKEEEVQENQVEQQDGLQHDNNLEQKIQMNKENEIEISSNINQEKLELHPTQNNQQEIQGNLCNQNEMSQLINENNDQPNKEELKQQDVVIAIQNQGQNDEIQNQVKESNQQQDQQNEISLKEGNQVIDDLLNFVQQQVEQSNLNQCLITENVKEINLKDKDQINSELLKIIDDSSSSSQSNNSQDLTYQQTEQQLILNTYNDAQQLDQINQETLTNNSDKNVEEQKIQIENKQKDQNEQLKNTNYQFSNQIEENNNNNQEINLMENTHILNEQNNLIQEENKESIKEINTNINEIDKQDQQSQAEQIGENKVQNEILQQSINNEEQKSLCQVDNLSLQIVEEERQKQQQLNLEQEALIKETEEQSIEVKKELYLTNQEQFIEKQDQSVNVQNMQLISEKYLLIQVEVKEQEASVVKEQGQLCSQQQMSELKQSMQVEEEVRQSFVDQVELQKIEEKINIESQIKEQYQIEQKQQIVEHDQQILIEEKQQQNLVKEDSQIEQQKEQVIEVDEQQQQCASSQSTYLNTQNIEEEKLQQQQQNIEGDKQQHIEEDKQQNIEEGKQQLLILEQSKQTFQSVDETQQQQQQLADDEQSYSIEKQQLQCSDQNKEQNEEFQQQQLQLIDQEVSEIIQTDKKLQKTEEQNQSQLEVKNSKQLEFQEEYQAISIINNPEENKDNITQNDEIEYVVEISNEQQKQAQQTVIDDQNNVAIEQQNEQLISQTQTKEDQNIQQTDQKVQAEEEQIEINNQNDQIQIQGNLCNTSQIEIEHENSTQHKQQDDAMEIETQIDEQPDHLDQDQFDQVLEQNLQEGNQSNKDDNKDSVIKNEQEIIKTKETEIQTCQQDSSDYNNQKEIFQQDFNNQNKHLKEEFDEKESNQELIKKDSSDSLQITQNISSNKIEELSNNSEIKLEDASNKIGSVMLDMEKFLKQKGLSDLKNQQTTPNSEVKTQNVDILLSKNNKLSQGEQTDRQSPNIKQVNDQIICQKDQDQSVKKNQSYDKQQIFDIVNLNNTVLSQMDMYLTQKSQKKEQQLNGDKSQEKQEIEQIESADKNYSFGNNSENIFERIKRESDKKLQESGFKISSDQRDSLIVTNIFTPSNAKAISDCGGAQTQFSNESFGITPKRINFLQSNKKSEAEITLINTDTQFQQLSQSQLKIGPDDQKLAENQEEITQNTSNSNLSSQLNSSNDNSKQQMSSELKMRTPLNHQVVLQIDEKKNAVKAPSSYTVISNRNNVLKSPVLSSQNNDKKNLKSNLIRDRSNSKSPCRQGLNLPQSQIEKPKGKSPLRQGVSLPKSAMRDDLSISSVNLSRFDLENEEYESKNLQNSTATQKRIQIPGDLAKIAQTLGIPKHNRNQCQLIENIYNLDRNVSKFMLNQSGKNILYQTLALLDDSIPNHFIVVVTNQFMTLRQKMNKQVSWACINSLMGVETLVQVQNLLMERKIKLLFIQQEYLLQEQYRFMRDQIKMIIYEDMTDKMLEINQIYNIQRYHLFHTMTFKTLEQVNQICEKCSLVNIDEQINLYGFDFSNINWTFESDKEKSLINFIRKNNLKKVIMYIDKSKKIDEIVSSFNQKGLKMQAYNSQKQDQILQLFSKDQFEILCCYNGQYIPKQIKQIVQYYIHYHIPRSVTSYVNDLNGYQYYHIQKGFIYEKFACGFLTELDFFEIRSDMVQELTEKKLIQTVLKTLNNNGTDGSQNKKKAGPAISDDFFFNVVLDETEQKIQEHYNNFMKDEDEFNLENESEANIQQIQITKFVNENCIKREVLIKILSYIAADQVQIMPFQGVVKMIQKNQLANNKIVSTLLKNNQNKTAITFSILDLATELQMTSQELNRALKKLNAEKKLQYEVKEELALLTIKPNIDQIFDKLFEQIRFQEEKQINDLDTMYLCAKLTCNLTLEQVFKYQKYKDMNKSSNLQEEGSVSLKVLLEKYLNENKGNQMCEMFTNNEKSKLPFISLKSQREKSNLLKDIQNLVPRVQKSKLNLVEFQLNKDFSQMDFESQSRFISLILQGIDGKNINEFKPALQFKKYFKFDYFDILQISFEYLQSYYTSLLQSETSKKIKI